VGIKRIEEKTSSGLKYSEEEEKGRPHIKIGGLEESGGV